MCDDLRMTNNHLPNYPCMNSRFMHICVVVCWVWWNGEETIVYGEEPVSIMEDWWLMLCRSTVTKMKKTKHWTILKYCRKSGIVIKRDETNFIFLCSVFWNDSLHYGSISRFCNVVWINSLHHELIPCLCNVVWNDSLHHRMIPCFIHGVWNNSLGLDPTSCNCFDFFFLFCKNM